VKALGPGPLRLLLGSFLLLIAAGTGLLKLPAATPPGQPITWIDALFTATSAACVTGLAVRDTGTGFTPLGQWILLGLVQLGGLGVMTLSLFILSLLRGKVSLAQRSILEQTVVTAAGRRLWPVLRLVFAFTFGAEALGAIVLFALFAGRMPAGEAAWQAVFHAVSAFCNAGFSLFRDNLVGFRGDAGVVLTLSALIILGGLGFFTVYDLAQSRRRRFRLSVHTKLAVGVSAVLIVFGTLAIATLEWRRGFTGMATGEAVLAALFQSVSARTAGFNSVDFGVLAPGTLFLVMALMFIGGSPGSCAGGIKTTTAGVLVLSAVATLRGRRHVNAFGRTLGQETVARTLSVALAALVVAAAGVFALVVLESPGGDLETERSLFVDYLFETVSALGTVGLSTGITAKLEPASRVLVALLMFIGRLGTLTVAVAIAGGERLGDFHHPEEDVMVG
jgi:trk system potassium uptake protein